MSGQELITDLVNEAEAPQMQPAKTESEANSMAKVVPEVMKALDPAEQSKEEEDDDGIMTEQECLKLLISKHLLEPNSQQLKKALQQSQFTQKDIIAMKEALSEELNRFHHDLEQMERFEKVQERLKIPPYMMVKKSFVGYKYIRAIQVRVDEGRMLAAMSQHSFNDLLHKTLGQLGKETFMNAMKVNMAKSEVI